MRRFLLLPAILACALLVAAVPAQAQSHFGVRAGVSADPNQFFFGVHADTAPLIPHLTFRPNVEIGVGDHATVVTLNVEFAYWIPVPKSEWSVYLGAGPAAVITNVHPSPGPSNTNTGGGFNVLVGAQHERGLFGELKVGFIDSPELKVTVGYTFR